MSDVGWVERRAAETRRSDEIEIRGLRVFGYHGVHPHEQQVGQPFLIDVVIGVDHQIAARTDDVDDTIDYADLVTVIADLVRSTRFNLLEALAANVADHLLGMPRVASARVRISKPEIELGEDVDAVAVTVHRARPVHIT